MRAWWWGIIAAGLTAALLFSRRASAAEPLPESKTVTVQGKPAPRGIRNHNPGNLRPGSPWKGLASPSVDDANYLIFIDAHHGLRALVINLVNQQRKHGLNTVRTIITKYAPPTENDTAAYIAAMSAALGVKPDDPLDLMKSRAQLEAFTRAVIRHENGVQPYSTAQLRTATAAALASFQP